MRIDARCLHFLAIAGVCLATAMATALAFEPGTRQVCVASSDGQSFECRDSSTPANAAQPIETATEAGSDTARTNPVEAAPLPAAPASAPMANPAPAAARPPNYLLQRPLNTGLPLPARAAAPAAVAEPAANTEPAPVSAAEPEPASAVPAPEADRAEPPSTIEADSPPPAAAPVTETAEASASPASEPTASPAPEPRASGSEAARPEPAAAESTAVNAATTAKAPTAPAPLPRDDVLGAEEFARLPSTHYTVVLASVRDPATLGTLIAAMADRPGALYLLKLGMPDGDWYSLCWAEFDNVEAARAARVQLPDETSLSSGWPRRIGLLQTETAP
jgi:hypothetical protein